MMALLRRLHRNRSQIKFSSRPRRAAISLFIYDRAIYDNADARDLQTSILTIETDRAACPIGGTGAPPQPRGGVEHHADDGTPRPIPLGAHNKTMVEQVNYAMPDLLLQIYVRNDVRNLDVEHSSK
jgi:hypothetical protein